MKHAYHAEQSASIHEANFFAYESEAHEMMRADAERNTMFLKTNTQLPEDKAIRTYSQITSQMQELKKQLLRIEIFYLSK